MRHFLAYSFGFLLMLTTAASADVPSTKEFEAEPDKLAQIVGDRQVVLLHKPRQLEWTLDGEKFKKKVRFVTSLMMIKAPAAKVRATVADFEKYPTFMPQNDSVKLTNKSEKGVTVGYELEFELPVMNVGVDYALTYTFEPDGSITWHAEEGGDIESNFGRWEFLELPEGRTLAAYTNWSDLTQMGMGVRMILSAQPDLQLAIPVASAAVIMDAVRRRAEGLPKEDKPPKKADAKEPTVPLLSEGQPPIPVDTMSKLARKGTVLFIHPQQWFQAAEGPMDFVFVSAAIMVKAPAEHVMNFSTQFERYKDFFEQIDKVKAKPTANGFNVDWRLKLGFGIFAVPIDYSLRYERKSPLVMPFHRVKGDITYLYGAWEWMKPSEEETLVFYTTGSQMGDKAPAILKLGNLVPNRQITVGVSSAAIILEKLGPWIEKQKPAPVAAPQAVTAP